MRALERDQHTQIEQLREQNASSFDSSDTPMLEYIPIDLIVVPLIQ
jgi:hypothetical protein